MKNTPPPMLLAALMLGFISGCSTKTEPPPSTSKPVQQSTASLPATSAPSSGGPKSAASPPQITEAGPNELLYDPKTNKSGFRSAKDRQKWLSEICEIENEVEPPEFSVTPSGLKYRLLHSTTGRQLTSDESHPLISYLITLDHGEDVEGLYYGSTGKKKRTIKSLSTTPMVKTYFPGFREGLKLMKEGEVMELEIAPELAYGNQTHDGVIPANSTLHVIVKLIAIDFVNSRETLKSLETQGYTKTPSGLLYKILKPSTGVKASFGDRLTFHCKLEVIPGKTIFDTYETGTPMVEQLNFVMPGMAEGLRQISQGGEIELIIPPALGYPGEQTGYGKTVPRGLPLKARITLISVENNPNFKWRRPDEKPANEKPAVDKKSPA